MKKWWFFYFSTWKSNEFSLFLRISNDFALFVSKVPVSCSKRFKNSPGSVKSKILTPAKTRFPDKCKEQCCGAGAGTFWSEPEPVWRCEGKNGAGAGKRKVPGAGAGQKRTGFATLD